MATCPDCNGSGYQLIIDPIADPTDPQPGIRRIPVGCGRCQRTGSVPDGEAEPPRPIPESRDDKLTRWSMVVLAVCLVTVIVLIVVWPFGP